MRALLSSLVLLAVVSVLSGAPLAAQSARPDPDPPVLRPGDSVRIAVYQSTELTQAFEVAPNGAPADPLYQEIIVAGVPIPVVEDRVRTFLSRFEARPRFVVLPRFRVALGGEIGGPGLYYFSPGTTIAQAVAQAGGATESGRLDRVHLIRESKLMVADLTELQPGAAQTPIHSGDQILVQRRRRLSFIRDIVVPIASVSGAVFGIIRITR
ncbi:MAG: polysaccharide biosynthesis/export family protein [bacterium]